MTTITLPALPYGYDDLAQARIDVASYTKPINYSIIDT